MESNLTYFWELSKKVGEMTQFLESPGILFLEKSGTESALKYLLRLARISIEILQIDIKCSINLLIPSVSNVN